MIRCWRKLLSLPPIPWNCSQDIILISEVGLGYKNLKYIYGDLLITGKGSQGSASFWTSLNFDNLSKAKRFTMQACPPLPLDGLQKMSPLKRLEISNCNNAFGPVENGRHAGYRFDVESMSITSVGGTSGKELTQILSCMPKLLALTIKKCDKITGLGVVEEQEEEAMASSSRRSREKEEDIEEAEEGLLLLPPQLHELSISSCPELRLRPLHNSVLHSENENENRGGLQTLCSLRSLSVDDCPKLLSCYASSSSIGFPFPSSLQSLELEGVETLPPLSNLASLSTLEIRNCGGDASGVGLGRLLAHGCLQELTVRETTNFFDSDMLSSIPSSSRSCRLLSSLETDDTAGVLAAPICRFLSSSLTMLVIYDKEMERFMEEQDEALQLLTSLQHLQFYGCEKLQSLPAGLHRLTSLKTLEIELCHSIRLLPNDQLPNSLPDSLQELHIEDCPSIRALPKGGLPTSLKLLEVRGGSEDLTRQCRNLIGTIPIVKLR